MAEPAAAKPAVAANRAFSKSVWLAATTYSTRFAQEEKELVRKLEPLKGPDGSIPFTAFCEALNTGNSFLSQRLYNICLEATDHTGSANSAPTDSSQPGVIMLSSSNSGFAAPAAAAVAVAVASPQKVARLALLMRHGSPKELARLVFDACHVTGEGRLSAKDLRLVLQEVCADNRVVVSPAAMDQLAADIVAQADSDGDGTVSFEEFYSLAMKYSRFRHLSRQRTLRFGTSRVLQPAPGSFRSAVQSCGRGVWYTLAEGLPSYFIWVLYVVIAAVGIYIYIRDPRFYEVGAWEVVIARFCGAGVAVAAVLLLPPVTKVLTDNLRSTFLANLFDFDNYISVHKVLGIIIFVGGIIHTVAWCISFAVVAGSTDPEKIAVMSGGNPPTLVGMFGSEIAITGYILMGILLLAYPFATSWPRRAAWLKNTRLGRLLNNTENFWISHTTLFIVFYAALICHPLPGNPAVAHKGKVWIYVIVPLSIYLCGLLWSLLKRGMSQAPVAHTQVLEAGRIVVLQLRKPQVMSRAFSYKAGQYVRIMCPEISRFEWHPITISSAPGDELLSLHIEAVGDWTGALYGMVKQAQDSAQGAVKLADSELGACPAPLPTIFIEGPYGAPSQAQQQYDVVVLIATGIGVTPMASILKDLANSARQGDCEGDSLRRRKVYFYWVVKEQQAPAWVESSLQAAMQAFSGQAGSSWREGRPGCSPVGLGKEGTAAGSKGSVQGEENDRAGSEGRQRAQQEQQEQGQQEQGSLLQVNIHYTGNRSGVAVSKLDKSVLLLAQEVHHQAHSRDFISGSESGTRVNFGRPAWDEVFRRIQRENVGTKDIGVIFCGAKLLKRELAQCCRKYSTPGGTRFCLHAEHF